MSCGTREALVFGMGLITGTGTTLYVQHQLSYSVPICQLRNLTVPLFATFFHRTGKVRFG
jgi:hypothetical protein